MTTDRRISTVMESPMDGWEKILASAVTPLARELRGEPGLEHFSFGRFNKPTWQIQLWAGGSPEWVRERARPLVEKHLLPLREAGLVRTCDFVAYEPELERYGGEEGVRLTERLYHHDSLACLDLMEAEAAGRLQRSRREFSLVMVEKVLDRLGFDRVARLALYERGWRWTLSIGAWTPEDLRLLDERFERQKPGMVELLRGRSSRSARDQWGGDEPARIAAACLEAAAPILEEARRLHAAGRLAQDIVNLAWFWTGMHSNRLGVVNVSEAILRYFMHRLYQDPAFEAS
jgi:class I lanthipeptide synthase